MKKEIRILLVLLVIAGGLSLYIFISSKPIDMQDEIKSLPAGTEQAGSLAERIDPSQIENEYRLEYRRIYDGFNGALMKAGLNIATGTEVTAATGTENLSGSQLIEALAQYKLELMELVVPEDEMDFHVNTVLALAQLKQSILDSDETAQKTSLESLRLAVANQPWLYQ